MLSHFAQSCLILCGPVNCSPPGSSVHGVFPTRIQEGVSIPSSTGSSQPRDQTLVLQADSLPLRYLGSPPVTSMTTLFPSKVTFWGTRLGLQYNFPKDAIQTMIHPFLLLFCCYSSHLLIPVSFYTVRFLFTLFSKMLLIFLSWPSHAWLVAACSQSKAVLFCSSLDFFPSKLSTYSV